MMIQLLLDGRVVNTDVTIGTTEEDVRATKRRALTQALKDGALKLGDTFRVTFRTVQTAAPTITDAA